MHGAAYLCSCSYGTPSDQVRASRKLQHPFLEMHVILKADFRGHSVVTGRNVAAPFLHNRHDPVHFPVNSVFSLSQDPFIKASPYPQVRIFLSDLNNITVGRHFKTRKISSRVTCF